MIVAVFINIVALFFFISVIKSLFLTMVSFPIKMVAHMKI
jgi:hypothetical protein